MPCGEEPGLERRPERRFREYTREEVFSRRRGACWLHPQHGGGFRTAQSTGDGVGRTAAGRRADQEGEDGGFRLSNRYSF